MTAVIIILAGIGCVCFFVSDIPREWAYKRFRLYEQSMYWRRDIEVAKFKEKATDKAYEKLERMRFICQILGREP